MCFKSSQVVYSVERERKGGAWRGTVLCSNLSVGDPFFLFFVFVFGWKWMRNAVVSSKPNHVVMVTTGRRKGKCINLKENIKLGPTISHMPSNRFEKVMCTKP